MSIDCPLCDWAHKPRDVAGEDTPYADGIARAMGTSADAFLAIRVHQEAVRTERKLDHHLSTHALVEWLAALMSERGKITRLSNDLRFHEAVEGHVLEIRTPTGWRPVRDYLEGTEQ